MGALKNSQLAKKNTRKTEKRDKTRLFFISITPSQAVMTFERKG